MIKYIFNFFFKNFVIIFIVNLITTVVLLDFNKLEKDFDQILLVFVKKKSCELYLFAKF